MIDLLFAAAIGLAAQSTGVDNPATPVAGMLVPARPLAIDGERSAERNKEFLHCTFINNRKLADQFIRGSSVIGLSASAGVAPDKIFERFSMKKCLSKAESSGRILLHVPTLRAMLMEESYLDRFRSARPSSLPVISPPNRPPVGLGGSLVKSQTYGALADCVVQQDFPNADALLRTLPASPAEQAAAERIRPTVTACDRNRPTGDVRTDSLRALVADGLWFRFAADRSPLE